ncbi:NADP-dependent aldehyde dehydrogenase [Alteromonadaceae bacterium Bs31]|nr:NADP-dependent aldehyde dehydrogenase [Alteromonadaceae bacterium Bs31]
MPLSGKQLVAGQWIYGSAGEFTAINPANGQQLPVVFSKASEQQVHLTCKAAEHAYHSYGQASLTKRAGFLRGCAEQIMALGDELLVRMELETGYTQQRCETERARTVNQLLMFADAVETAEFLDPRVDAALPNRKPLARPELRFVNQPIGPVAVFAVSNFPLAYSTAGGDSASALAAGCPIVVKGHPSHPGTGELVAQALQLAAAEHAMPEALISYIQGDNDRAAQALIKAPEIKAIGFTGSQNAGMAICKMAAKRPEPIPVFAEMGSINPLILLPGALNTQARKIANDFVQSLTLGSGQFCVKPGLVIAIESEQLEQFIAAVAQELRAVPAGVMLNQTIYQNYNSSVEALKRSSVTQTEAQGKEPISTEGFYVQAHVFSVRAADFLRQPRLQEEVFGPCAVLVRCKQLADISELVKHLQGQLTASIHGENEELKQLAPLIKLCSQKAGRTIVNGFPTGVEVCSSTVHGGPYPASSDPRFTAVGTAAIKRWLRPVCYQNFPEFLLPDLFK